MLSWKHKEKKNQKTNKPERILNCIEKVFTGAKALLCGKYDIQFDFKKREDRRGKCFHVTFDSSLVHVHYCIAFNKCRSMWKTDIQLQQQETDWRPLKLIWAILSKHNDAKAQTPAITSLRRDGFLNRGKNSERIFSKPHWQYFCLLVYFLLLTPFFPQASKKKKPKDKKRILIHRTSRIK